MKLIQFDVNKAYNNLTIKYLIKIGLQGVFRASMVFSIYVFVSVREVKPMFEQINQKKELLDANRPLPKYTVKSLREKLLLEWTYNTNAIEGNT